MHKSHSQSDTHDFFFIEFLLVKATEGDMILDEKDKTIIKKFVHVQKKERRKKKLTATLPPPANDATVSLMEPTSSVNLFSNTGTSKPVTIPTEKTGITSHTTQPSLNIMSSQPVRTQSVVIVTEPTVVATEKPLVVTTAADAAITGTGKPFVTKATQKVLKNSNEAGLMVPTKQRPLITSPQRIFGSPISSGPSVTSQRRTYSKNEQQPDGVHNTVTTKRSLPSGTVKPITATRNHQIYYASDSKDEGERYRVGRKESRPNLNIGKPIVSNGNQKSQEAISNNNLVRPHNNSGDKRVTDDRVKKKENKDQVTPFGRKLWITRIIPYKITHKGSHQFSPGNNRLYPLFTLFLWVKGTLCNTQIWEVGGVRVLVTNGYDNIVW